MNIKLFFVFMFQVGLAVPYKSFGYREYTRAVSTVVAALQKSTKKPNLRLFDHYDIFVKVVMQELTPSPKSLLTTFYLYFFYLLVLRLTLHSTFASFRSQNSSRGELKTFFTFHPPCSGKSLLYITMRLLFKSFTKVWRRD